jgi:hypothetical protein
MNKNCLTVMALLALGSACATHPERVPDIDQAAVPKLELPGLKPQSIELQVKNTRAVNKTAGNSADVERAIQASLADSLTRGGLKVGASKNRLGVTIEDCPDAPDGAECVKLVGKFATPGLQLDIEATSSQGYQKGTHVVYGDVSQAYQGGLQLLLRMLDSKYREMHSR